MKFRILSLLILGFLLTGNSSAHASLCRDALAQERKLIENDPDFAIGKLLSLGFSQTVASRLVRSNEVMLPYLLSETPLVVPKKTLNDTGRGYLRHFYLPRIPRSASFRAVTVYRGIGVKSLADLKLDSRSHKILSSRVGGVAWVTPNFDEARGYAEFQMDSRSWAQEKRASGVPEEEILDRSYILKLSVSKNMLFAPEENEIERFLIPTHFQNLRNYLLGVYELTEKIGDGGTGNVKVRYIPFENLPEPLKRD